jgi:hypothetical protein
MKYIIAIILILPLCCAAQDCKIIRETDPYTKETKVSTGFITLDGASVTIDGNSSEIDMFFTMDGGEKCFDNNSTAYIFFEGTKLKVTTRNSGSMNCEGFFHFTFRNTPTTQSMLQKIATQKIHLITFTSNSKKENKIELSPQQQDAVMNFTNCLVNEAKKLIK